MKLTGEELIQAKMTRVKPHDMRRMTTPADRLKRARFQADELSIPVPNRILRDYLDSQAYASKFGPGLHNITITIGRRPILGLLTMDYLLDSSIRVKVEGQKHGR